MASRAGATKEMRGKVSYHRHEAKLMDKIKRLQKKVKKTKKTDDSSVLSMSSAGTNVSYWINNITFHGGDKNNLEEINIGKADVNKINNEVNITHELNILDKIISIDCASSNKLLNDFHKNEMKNNSKMEPTPVTIAAVKGGKKNREWKYSNLRVLIDTGSLHSLFNIKYSSKSKRK